jgi:hypothetical protein
MLNGGGGGLNNVNFNTRMLIDNAIAIYALNRTGKSNDLFASVAVYGKNLYNVLLLKS